jgi:hypothetical protein
MPRKKKEQIKEDLHLLPEYCKAFLRLAKKEDDMLASFITERGMKDVVGYMVQEVKEKYSNKTTFTIDDGSLYKVVEYLHQVYIEGLCAEMVKEGLLTEDVTADGQIMYTRTDKMPEGGK